MKRALKILSIVFGVFILFLGILYTDAYIYPFKADNPNYSDVEAAFSKLQFPADWKQVSSSEDKGIRGRACDPFMKNGCFHKSQDLDVPQTTSAEQIEKLFLEAGCLSPQTKDISPKGLEATMLNIRCAGTSGLNYGADLDKKKNRLYVTVQTY